MTKAIKQHLAIGYHKDIINLYPGFKVYVSDFACMYTEYVQYKFPKSKKIRIRNKWSKRTCNFKHVVSHKVLVDRIKGCIYISSLVYEKVFKSGKDLT